jgi:hypothetical protein
MSSRRPVTYSLREANTARILVGSGFAGPDGGHPMSGSPSTTYYGSLVSQAKKKLGWGREKEAEDVT